MWEGAGIALVLKRGRFADLSESDGVFGREAGGGARWRDYGSSAEQDAPPTDQKGWWAVPTLHFTEILMIEG